MNTNTQINKKTSNNKFTPTINITCLERIVIESLSKKNRNIYELSQDTNISASIISNIIFNLTSNNITIFKNGTYILNRDNYKNWIHALNSQQNIKGEAEELFSALISNQLKNKKRQKAEDSNQKTNTKFNLKKVWMTEKEDKILNTMLSNITSFLQNLPNEQNKDCSKTSRQQVIFLGSCQYGNLINEILKP